ncbi:TPA: glycosyltransferase [Legionella feeleii]|uniref:Lipopolysaccharide biosynthesis glycosyltransferase n=1 Tax=Legionella feeleii TaxID=453 RepID=A0A0W0U175_9GAMM|nr:glycosyltransferase family 2 protein [Legionella feeleii]KTD01503.1 lipopolysaccharide biosynthesis glycosyltransferase [Legionella feeleii]SPX61314.1 lipopolysaccharide biosynthesis glycosyltransferase [Legionella feeleii]STX38911.1 lipopolysaccharide biosynthesis glycosyltransferase [Legionella feeleii]
MSLTTDPTGKRVTVAMITKNEEKAVGRVIQDIKQVVPDAEIVIIDSSADQTATIAEEMGAKVIRQIPPRGYGPAMERALREASREVIITLDCDNTYPSKKIPELASLILDQGYDLVDASRLRKKPQAMPWSNYFGNVVFAWLASLLFFRHLTDLHSGMRAYRKTMIDALQFDAQGAALPVELLLKPIISGYKVHTVFIDYHERIGQSKMNALDTSWWTIKRIIKVRMHS